MIKVGKKYRVSFIKKILGDVPPMQHEGKIVIVIFIGKDVCLYPITVAPQDCLSEEFSVSADELKEVRILNGQNRPRHFRTS